MSKVGSRLIESANRREPMRGARFARASLHTSLTMLTSRRCGSGWDTHKRSSRGASDSPSMRCRTGNSIAGRRTEPRAECTTEARRHRSGCFRASAFTPRNLQDFSGQYDSPGCDLLHGTRDRNRYAATIRAVCIAEPNRRRLHAGRAATGREFHRDRAAAGFSGQRARAGLGRNLECAGIGTADAGGTEVDANASRIRDFDRLRLTSSAWRDGREGLPRRRGQRQRDTIARQSDVRTRTVVAHVD